MIEMDIEENPIFLIEVVLSPSTNIDHVDHRKDP